MVYSFTVPDLACGHCVKAISKALSELDAEAKVSFDLQSKCVTVESALSHKLLRRSIEAAGYSVGDGSIMDATAADCCGHCSSS